MEIKGNWVAKSKPEKNEKNNVKKIVGQWGMNINTKVSKPYTYSKGPIN